VYQSSPSGLVNFIFLKIEKTLNSKSFLKNVKKPSKSDLFINIFAWKKIPEPESDETPIPVFGQPAEIFKIYTIVNIAFSPGILEKYGKNSGKPYETELLISLAFNYVEDQNKTIVIDKSNYEILANVNCKGDVNKCIEKLTSRSGAAPDINPNMSDLEMAKEALNAFDSSKGDSSKLPDSILNKLIGMDLNQKANKTAAAKSVLVEELDTKIVEKPATNLILEIPSFESKISQDHFEIKISLPKINSISECDLNVDEHGLTLSANSQFYSELKVSFADMKKTHEVSVNDVEAKFVKKTCLLKIKMPIVLK
jgi:hypothetical protein